MTMREMAEKAFELGFACCRGYGDNHVHFSGEQKERVMAKYLDELLSPVETPRCKTCGREEATCRALVAQKLTSDAHSFVPVETPQPTGAEPKVCKECRETGAVHCNDPGNCGGPWSDPLPSPDAAPAVTPTSLCKCGHIKHLHHGNCQVALCGCSGFIVGPGSARERVDDAEAHQEAKEWAELASRGKPQAVALPDIEALLKEAGERVSCGREAFGFDEPACAACEAPGDWHLIGALAVALRAEATARQQAEGGETLWRNIANDRAARIARDFTICAELRARAEQAEQARDALRAQLAELTTPRIVMDPPPSREPGQ